MNPAVRDAASDLLRRAFAADLQGYRADPGEVKVLRRELNGVLPEWYADLLTDLPLCGVMLHFDTGKYDPYFEANRTYLLYWNDPTHIRMESLEAHPGTVLLSRGYLCIAGDEGGSGDGVFINTEEGDDPPVYHFDHEAGLDADTLLARGRTLLCTQLSELFNQAVPTAASPGPGQEPYWPGKEQ